MTSGTKEELKKLIELLTVLQSLMGTRDEQVDIGKEVGNIGYTATGGLGGTVIGAMVGGVLGGPAGFIIGAIVATLICLDWSLAGVVVWRLWAKQYDFGTDQDQINEIIDFIGTFEDNTDLLVVWNPENHILTVVDPISKTTKSVIISSDEAAEALTDWFEENSIETSTDSSYDPFGNTGDVLYHDISYI